MSHTDLDTLDGDHGTVGLVEDIINLLQVVRVRDELVAGDDILFPREEGLLASASQRKEQKEKR